MPQFLTKRAGFWHFARRVPAEFAALDPRGVIKHSTKIRVDDDPAGIGAAKLAADQLNKDLESFWGGLVTGQHAEAHERYDAARKRARVLGFEYASIEELQLRPLEELVRRLEALMPRERVHDELTRAAVLGGEKGVTVPLSRLFEAFQGYVRAEIADYSEDQKRRWTNAKKRAITNLTKVVGDKPIGSLSRSDALEFREWWAERILEEQLDPDTANKDMGHISSMIREINLREQLGINPIFAELRFKGGFQNSRVPYPRDFIAKQILAPGRLTELNVEARGVVFLMAGAGLRVTEAVNLNARTIRLDTEIPHVQVRPDGRRMKTKQSLREIPLCGVALEAMRDNPKGFPRYHDAAATASATINAFFTDNGLRPNEGESLYSLRHSFKDALIDREAPDSLIDHLMGHKDSGPKYGHGPSLQLKLKWCQAIAFNSCVS